MKRKVFSIIGVAAFAGAVAFNVSSSLRSESLLDLSLANVEALASDEGNADCSDGNAKLCCKIWTVKYYSSGSYDCTTGGSYKCTGC